MLFGGVLPLAITFPFSVAVKFWVVLPRKNGPGRGRELEPVDQVRPDVAVRVDVDRVPGAWRERVPVRAGGRILTRDPVRDDRERARLVRAAERVQVRVVRRRILRDQRCLPVAGGRARARAETPDIERDESGGHRDQEDQRIPLHSASTPFSDGLGCTVGSHRVAVIAAHSLEPGDRFGPRARSFVTDVSVDRVRS